MRYEFELILLNFECLTIYIYVYIKKTIQWACDAFFKAPELLQSTDQ